MAKIQLNGKKVVIKTNTTLLDLLKKYKLTKKKVAVEYNGIIIQNLHITGLEIHCIHEFRAHNYPVQNLHRLFL